MIAVLVQIPIGDGEDASGSFLFTSQRKCVTVNAIPFFLFFFLFLVCVLGDLPFHVVVMGWNLIYSYIMKMMFLYSFWHLSHHSLKHHEKKNHTKSAFGLGVFCPILRLRFSKTFFFHAFWGVLGVAATVYALFNEQ